VLSTCVILGHELTTPPRLGQDFPLLVKTPPYYILSFFFVFAKVLPSHQVLSSPRLDESW
jgi:hypothetical protein